MQNGAPDKARDENSGRRCANRGIGERISLREKDDSSCCTENEQGGDCRCKFIDLEEKMMPVLFQLSKKADTISLKWGKILIELNTFTSLCCFLMCMDRKNMVKDHLMVFIEY